MGNNSSTVSATTDLLVKLSYPDVRRKYADTLAAALASRYDVIAFDFDRTLVGVHTGGAAAATSVPTIANSFSADCYALLTALKQFPNVCTGVVTFGDPAFATRAAGMIAGRPLIGRVLSAHFGEEQAAKVPIVARYPMFYTDPSAYRPLGLTEPMPMSKSYHIQELLKTVAPGREILPSRILLVDDDNSNCRAAIAEGQAAVWVDAYVRQSIGATFDDFVASLSLAIAPPPGEPVMPHVAGRDFVPRRASSRRGAAGRKTPPGATDAAAVPPPERVCAFCGEVGDQRCTGCRSVWYCGAGCQKLDWANHRPMCRPPKETAGGAAAGGGGAGGRGSGPSSDSKGSKGGGGHSNQHGDQSAPGGSKGSPSSASGAQQPPQGSPAEGLAAARTARPDGKVSRKFGLCAPREARTAREQRVAAPPPPLPAAPTAAAPLPLPSEGTDGAQQQRLSKDIDSAQQQRLSKDMDSAQQQRPSEGTDGAQQQRLPLTAPLALPITDAPEGGHLAPDVDVAGPAAALPDGARTPTPASSGICEEQEAPHVGARQTPPTGGAAEAGVLAEPDPESAPTVADAEPIRDAESASAATEVVAPSLAGGNENPAEDGIGVKATTAPPTLAGDASADFGRRVTAVSFDDTIDGVPASPTVASVSADIAPPGSPTSPVRRIVITQPADRSARGACWGLCGTPSPPRPRASPHGRSFRSAAADTRGSPRRTAATAAGSFASSPTSPRRTGGPLMRSPTSSLSVAQHELRAAKLRRLRRDRV